MQITAIQSQLLKNNQIFTTSFLHHAKRSFKLAQPKTFVVLHGCRLFHKSTKLNINRFLFDSCEIDSSTNNDGMAAEIESDLLNKSSDIIPTVTLPKEDYRTVHAAKILGLLNGDNLRAGIIQDHGNNGGLITDKATITWLPEGKIKKAQPTKNGDPPGSLRITLHSLISPQNDLQNTDMASRISLILALPRPLALSRLLPMISQMGVHHLVLISAQKVPKDYFGSHLFRKPNELRKLLIEGLSQSGDVRIPKITIVKQLKPFMEDNLTTLFPSEEWARVIAHPQKKADENKTDVVDDDDDIKVQRMRDVFPKRVESGHVSPPNIVLAVGPEGGWTDYELNMFQQLNFEQITLGSRTLRTDVAVISLLTLAHDSCSL